MFIEKIAKQENAFRRNFRYFSSARKAFHAYLNMLIPLADQIVLLPSYIGWSPREGSGVFDPIIESKVPYDFYRMNRNLHVDLDHLKSKLQLPNTKLMLLIHYFGYRDPNYEKIVALAQEHEVLVLEDQAHSFFGDMVYGSTGRLGHASIFSLHKMLPLPDGGILALNDDVKKGAVLGKNTVNHCECFEYDFFSIAQRRRDNAEKIAMELRQYHDEIMPIRPDLLPYEVPQTFPVIIKNVSRDDLYTIMNDAGYGVVSLYHTMIEQISRESYPESHWLSNRILNLPVHQDMTIDQVSPMIEVLLDSIDNLKM